MIRSITSSLPSFKSLAFQPGLNVLLAQKSAGATERQTRNGAGKTSLVEIVHFLLGSDLEKGHVLRAEPLERESFQMSFDLSGAPVTVERSAAHPSDITVLDGAVEKWPRQPRLNLATGHLHMKVDEWIAVLGALVFGLPDPEDNEKSRFKPTWRSLISYFARRESAKGFLRPEQYSDKQQPWNQQVSITYLLGLDASIPQAFQEVRQREEALKQLRKAAGEGPLEEVVGKASELRAHVAMSEARTRALRERLASFRVVPEYREYEEEASRITAQMAKLSNQNQADLELVARLEEALSSEIPPRFAEVEGVFRDAGVVLPELVARRFEEVERFHRSVVENRRSHLRGEIDAAQERIHEREREQRELDARRSQLMGILRAGGALDQFTRLQEELARLEAQAESLRKRFAIAETLEREGTELKIERARLEKRLQEDLHEQREVLEQATLAFARLSSALYEHPGILMVNPTSNGPKFEPKIEGERSTGITKMQIFCFDMTLMELAVQRGRGPGFLIHDSHLFDGVDERQRAKALELGAAQAARLGFQYIVTLNEDDMPVREFSPDFLLDSHVLSIRLDDSEAGGLFGIRFD